MMQQLTRIYNDNTTGPYWVNPDHVVSVTALPARDDACHVNTFGSTQLIKGAPRDVVRILNGQR